MGLLSSARYLAELQARAERAVTLTQNVKLFTETLQGKVYPIRLAFKLEEDALKISATYRKYGYTKIIDFETLIGFVDVSELAKLEAENINKKFPL